MPFYDSILRACTADEAGRARYMEHLKSHPPLREDTPTELFYGVSETFFFTVRDERGRNIIQQHLANTEGLSAEQRGTLQLVSTARFALVEVQSLNDADGLMSVYDTDTEEVTYVYSGAFDRPDIRPGVWLGGMMVRLGELSLFVSHPWCVHEKARTLLMENPLRPGHENSDLLFRILVNAETLYILSAESRALEKQIRRHKRWRKKK
jgi:hypothetical protein